MQASISCDTAAIGHSKKQHLSPGHRCWYEHSRSATMALQEGNRWLTGVLTELMARACTDTKRPPQLLHCMTHPKLQAPIAASSLGTRTRCTAAERGCRKTGEASLLLAACTLSSPSGKTAT